MTLSGRLILVGISLVLATVAAVWYPIQHNLEAELVPAALQRLASETDKRASEFVRYLGSSVADVRMLQESPSVAALVGAESSGGTDPHSGLGTQQAKAFLARMFAAFMAAHPQVLQARLIGVADGGREIVRVDRTMAGGPLRTVAESDLQAKGGREYFRKMVAAPPGEVVSTPIELNREFGNVDVPHVPVVRVGMPVYRATGVVLGIVILNYDLRPLFERLNSGRETESRLFVTNPDGDYLVHPDVERTFGFDLGRRFRIQDEFPQIANAFSGNTGKTGFIRDASGADVAFSVTPVFGPEGVVAEVVEILPKSVVLATVDTAWRSSLITAGMAALIASVVAVLVARSLTQPIRQTAYAVEAGGAILDANLPIGGPSEVRVLTSAIRKFVGNERFYRSALESANQAVITTALDGTVTSWNRAAQAMYGYSADDAVGHPIGIIVPDDRRQEADALVRRIIAGELVDPLDTERLTRSGERIVVSLMISSVRDASGKVVGISTIAHDVTAQRRIEELFRLSVDASPAGIVVVDDRGVVVLANIVAETMFGYDSGALLGERIEILVPPALRVAHAHDFRTYLKEPTARAMGKGRELRGRRRDGSEFAVEIGLSPFTTSAGVHVFAVIVDVTERQRADAQLQARTRELERSNAELAQFAYVASHDLQEPLRMVSGFCDLLKRKYGAKLEGDGLDYIAFAIDGAERMQQLISDLLAYSRLNTRPHKPARVSIDRVLAVVQRDLAAAIAETGATIVHDNMPDIRCDPTRARQLFQNLLSNAIRFRGEAPPEIRIAAERDGGFWRFSVSDNGIGIDYEHRERIFEVFQRLHTRDEYSGTGIGLAVCKRIVEHAGGAIWLDRREGSGATFMFTLPAAEGDRNDC